MNIQTTSGIQKKGEKEKKNPHNRPKFGYKPMGKTRPKYRYCVVIISSPMVLHIG